MDKRLRQIMDCNRRFGGMSIIFSGDFAQLPPVSKSKIVYIDYPQESTVEKDGKVLYNFIDYAIIPDKIQR